MKLRTKKIVAKRFRITKNGLVLRGNQMGRHLRSHKSKSQLRKYKVRKLVTGPMARAVRQFLPYN